MESKMDSNNLFEVTQPWPLIGGSDVGVELSECWLSCIMVQTKILMYVGERCW